MVELRNHQPDHSWLLIKDQLSSKEYLVFIFKHEVWMIWRYMQFDISHQFKQARCKERFFPDSTAADHGVHCWQEVLVPRVSMIEKKHLVGNVNNIFTLVVVYLVRSLQEDSVEALFGHCETPVGVSETSLNVRISNLIFPKKIPSSRVATKWSWRWGQK